MVRKEKVSLAAEVEQDKPFGWRGVIWLETSHDFTCWTTCDCDTKVEAKKELETLLDRVVVGLQSVKKPRIKVVK